MVVEADDLLNVDSEGAVKSEFAPGESFNFLVQHDDSVRITGVGTSSGAVSSRGVVARSKTSQQSFVDDTAADLGSIPSGAVTGDWYGRAPVLSVDGRSVRAGSFSAIGELSWQAAMHSYALAPPALDLAGDDKYYIDA